MKAGTKQFKQFGYKCHLSDNNSTVKMSDDIALRKIEEFAEYWREQVEIMLDIEIYSEFNEDLMSHACDTPIYTDCAECEVNDSLVDLRGFFLVFKAIP